jgi:hypothetical protein
MDDHLNPRSRALLDRARAAREPTDDDEARVRARIAAALAAGAAGTAGGAASASGASGAASGSAGAAGGAGAAAGSAAGTAAATGGGGGWIAGVVAVLTVGGLAAGGVALNLGGSGAGSGDAEVEIGEGVRSGPGDEIAPAGDPAGGSRPLGGAAEGASTDPGGPPLPLDGLESDEAIDELDEDAEADLEADRRVGDRERRRSQRGRPSFGGGSARPKRADRPADLAAEVALLRDADAELQAGDALRALALVRIHARRFLDSQLWAERDATRILALCALDRVDEARRRRATEWRAHRTPRCGPPSVRAARTGDDRRPRPRRGRHGRPHVARPAGRLPLAGRGSAAARGFAPERDRPRGDGAHRRYRDAVAAPSRDAGGSVARVPGAGGGRLRRLGRRHGADGDDGGPGQRAVVIRRGAPRAGRGGRRDAVGLALAREAVVRGARRPASPTQRSRGPFK